MISAAYLAARASKVTKPAGQSEVDIPLRMLFLFPQVWDPLKENFAGQFNILPERCSGYIFALSSKQKPVVEIGRFQLRWRPIADQALSRLWNGLVARVLLPLRHVCRGEIDAVIAYDPYACGLAGILLRLVLGGKVIIQLNGDFHEYPPSSNPLKGWVMRAAFHFSLTSADAVKVLNVSQEEYVRRHYPAKPVYRFHDYVACHYFESVSPLSGDYLLFVGYPFDLKRVDVVIRAFLKIADRYPKFSLRVMGYCPEPELSHYRQLAQNHSRIHFVEAGWVEEVREQMRGCYAFVNPTQTEALGRVHIEAMSCGKPIVASNTNGARECIVDGATGLLFDVGDVDGLARQLDRLLSDSALASRLGQAGRERARAVFSEERFAAAFLHMVDSTVGPSKRTQ